MSALGWGEPRASCPSLGSETPLVMLTGRMNPEGLGARCFAQCCPWIISLDRHTNPGAESQGESLLSALGWYRRAWQNRDLKVNLLAETESIT